MSDELEKQKNNLKLEEILQQIKNWLKNLDGTFEEIKIQEQNAIVLHVKFNFNYNTENKNEQYQYFVSLLYDSDVFKISTYCYFDKGDATSFKLLQSTDKVKFANMLKIPLLCLNLEYMWVPDIMNFDSLEISRKIYHDGFSKDRFMSSVDALLHGYEIVSSIYQDFKNEIKRRYQ